MGTEASLIGGGLSLLGGALGGSSATEAARSSADAQIRAAQIAAEASRFRPVGVTTRYGTSQFQMTPEGYLQSAGYTLSPEYQAYQNQLSQLLGQQLQQGLGAQQQYEPLQRAAGGLFNLGAGYLAQTPEQGRCFDWVGLQSYTH